MEMENETAELYLKAIEMIEAQNMLLDLKIADFPHLTNSKRKKLHASLFKKAYPDLDDTEKERISMEEFVLRMANRG